MTPTVGYCVYFLCHVVTVTQRSCPEIAKQALASLRRAVPCGTSQWWSSLVQFCGFRSMKFERDMVVNVVIPTR